jgi:hypothetical protein
MDDSSDDIDVNDDDDDAKSERRQSCVVCRKQFSSKNRFDVHCRNHRNVLSTQFRLVDPIPSNVIASLSPLSTSSPPRASPKSMSSPNAMISSTSAMKRERTFRVSVFNMVKKNRTAMKLSSLLYYQFNSIYFFIQMDVQQQSLSICNTAIIGNHHDSSYKIKMYEDQIYKS